MAVPCRWFGPDVVEHDPAEARALVGQGGEERPHRPLRHVGEAAPVGLHGVVHLGVRPQGVGAGAAQGHDAVAAAAGDAEAGAAVDVLDRDGLGRDRRRAIRVGADVERGHGGHPGGGVVLELDLVGEGRPIAVGHRHARRPAPGEPHGRRGRRTLERRPHDGDADVGVGAGRARAVAVEDRPRPGPRADPVDSCDPVDPDEQAAAQRAARHHLRIAAVDVEAELPAEAEIRARDERGLGAVGAVELVGRLVVQGVGERPAGLVEAADPGQAPRRQGQPAGGLFLHGGVRRQGVVDRLGHVGPPGRRRGRAHGQA